MNCEVKKDHLVLSFEAKNDGKFRFKKRENNLEFGKTFATKKDIFDNNVYLEWQIGYDAEVNKVKKGEKKTSLTDEYFIASNRKKKYLYELSEILYHSMHISLVEHNIVEGLLNEIKQYNTFLDEKKISIEHHSQISIYGIKYHELSIKLPSYFMIETSDNTQIEVSIQKQQYATGVQPMIYFCIPLKTFANGNEYKGRSSKKSEMLLYNIDNNNISNILLLFRVFAMASHRHNHDIIEILDLLLKIK